MIRAPSSCLASMICLLALGACSSTRNTGDDARTDRWLDLSLAERPTGDSQGAEGAGDGRSPDSKPATCSTHCDCLQGAFCFNGKCLVDPKVPAYCCKKSGCPPGRWCVNPDGSKAICPRDDSYVCVDACDCGPGHCCRGGKCVRDVLDPWLPKETSTSTSCKHGEEPTYCCTAPECQAGRLAYGAAAETAFRCYNRDRNAVEAFCGGSYCFGTACRCAPGEMCVDTVPLDPAAQKYPPTGKSCWLLAGGSCVSLAAAASLFNVKTSDLLPCCSNSCSPNGLCDAGAERRGGTWAYQRIVKACGSCGNGKCDDGEWPSTCPGDCKCGDGKCAPEEVGKCPADCGFAGNGVCDPGESPKDNPTDCKQSCGDGWCAGAETAASCPADCPCLDAPLYPAPFRVCGDGKCESSPCDPETCLSCPKECGSCKWVREENGLETTRGTSANLFGLWASSPSDIYAVGGGGTIYHFDGMRWSHQISRTGTSLYSVSGSSATSIFAVGVDGTVVGYNGTQWLAVAGAPKTVLRGVAASSPNNVYVVGDSGQVHHYDGTTWSSLYALLPATPLKAVWLAPSGELFAVGNGGIALIRASGGAWTAYKPATNPLYGVWGTSASNVFAVGDDGALRFDGGKWSSVPAPGFLRAVGGSAGAVFAVGDKGLFTAYDGNNFVKVSKNPVIDTPLYAVYVFGSKDVLAVGEGGLILRYDGTTVKRVEPRGSHDLFAVGGSSASDVLACGARGTILHHDGTKWDYQLSRDADYDLHGLWSTTGTSFCVGGFRGGAMAQGVAWQYPPGKESPLPNPARGVWGSSPNDVWAVGQSGSVNHFDGTGWTLPTSLPQTNQALRSVWGSGMELFIVGLASTIFRFDGKTWISMSASPLVDLLGVWGSSSSNVYAVGSGGSILRYGGVGLTWTAVPSPPATGMPTLHGVWGSSPNDVIAVGQKSTIVRFDGTTWKKEPVDVRYPTSSAYNCPALAGAGGFAATTVFVVGEEGTILRRSP